MNELTVQEPARPATIQEAKQQTDLIIQQATYWASSLMSVVEKCGMAKNVAGKKYLQVEAWLMIGEFAHVTPVIEWVKPWEGGEDGIIGYEARAQLQNEAGQIIGAGESSCGFDAFPCRGKSGSEKDKAAKSAAQTWAISRALRNKFGYVAKLGGYEAVPYEEMADTLHRAKDAPQSTNAEKPKETYPAKPNPAKSAKAALYDALLAHTNENKADAKKILVSLTGKQTLSDLTEQQASVALEKFHKEYPPGPPIMVPDDDDIPESWPVNP